MDQDTTATEIAEKQEKLWKGKELVDVVDSKGLKKYNVTPYDLIVVGSRIKIGKQTKESLKFLKDNKSLLTTKK